MIFDGRQFVAKIEEELRLKVAGMDKKPRLAVLLDPKNEAGAKYVEQKRKFGERIGVELLVVSDWSLVDQEADGIMIQLPYPDSEELIKMIPPEKDVDGLRENSPYKQATVRAVLEILGTQPVPQGLNVVVGNKGEVGRRLQAELSIKYGAVVGMDKDDFFVEELKIASVIVSATGQAGLIKPEMVKEGVVCIDVGFPKGDFDLKIASKASFFTPVPGGVGPVTVAMLFKNLIDNIK